MRFKTLSPMVMPVVMVALAACSADAPTGVDEDVLDTRTSMAPWHPAPRVGANGEPGEAAVYLCKISALAFQGSYDPSLGVPVDFDVSIGDQASTRYTTPVQTWASRDANTCALVYDSDAGPELTLTELEVLGSTLVSINTESDRFDAGFTEVGNIDMDSRTITLPAVPGVTIVYFKNLYEGIPDEGCSLTPGYWQTHSERGPAPYDATWAMLADGADTEFFTTGSSWYETFHTSPRGNAYYQLAFHYMAAVLNGLNGADTSVVKDELDAAKLLFKTYSPRQIASLRGRSSIRRDFIALAGVLASYNEGDIGPGHCG